MTIDSHLTWRHAAASLAIVAVCNVAGAGAAWAQPAGELPVVGATAGEVPASQVPVSDASVQRAAALEHIGRERQMLREQLRLEEAGCYQQFAVEDCLREARAKLRHHETRLRAQEIELNDADRRERAAARLRVIEEKKNQPPPEAPVPRVRNATAPTQPRAVPAPLPAPRDVEGLKNQHDVQARQRAQAQRDRLQNHAQQQAEQKASSAQRATAARERQENALRDAQERRARLEKAQADAKAAGRTHGAPLPVPGAKPAPTTTAP